MFAWTKKKEQFSEAINMACVFFLDEDFQPRIDKGFQFDVSPSLCFAPQIEFPKHVGIEDTPS